MMALIILSLVTVTGLFFIYRILALDNSSAVDAAPQPVFKNTPKAPSFFSKLSLKKNSGESKPKTAFFKSRKDSLKVEPITSLKDYYSQQSQVAPEADLTQAHQNFQQPQVQEPPKPVVSAQQESYEDLKDRLSRLQSDYEKADRLLHERTVKLDQAERSLEDTKLKQNFEHMQSSQKPEEFVSLPPDLMKPAKPQDHNDIIKNLTIEQPKTDAPFRMESEENIIKRLTDNKNS